MVPNRGRAKPCPTIVLVPSDRKIRKFIRQWRRRYPFPFPWVGDRANGQCRKSEERWLLQFTEASTLKRRQVLALIDWGTQGHPDCRESALHGVTGAGEWGHARRCLRKALSTPNPVEALDRLLDEREGISGWGPFVASVVLAACRPHIYAIADPRALRTLEALELYKPSATGEFSRADWWPYLHLCRRWAKECNLTPLAVSEVLSAAADAAPELPITSKHPKAKGRLPKSRPRKRRK